jgi:hypothetical protein
MLAMACVLFASSSLSDAHLAQQPYIEGAELCETQLHRLLQIQSLLLCTPRIMHES